jgi:hypothetical protein
VKGKTKYPYIAKKKKSTADKEIKIAKTHKKEKIRSKTKENTEKA